MTEKTGNGSTAVVADEQPEAEDLTDDLTGYQETKPVEEKPTDKRTENEDSTIINGVKHGNRNSTTSEGTGSKQRRRSTNKKQSKSTFTKHENSKVSNTSALDLLNTVLGVDTAKDHKTVHLKNGVFVSDCSLCQEKRKWKLEAEKQKRQHAEKAMRKRERMEVFSGDEPKDFVPRIMGNRNVSRIKSPLLLENYALQNGGQHDSNSPPPLPSISASISFNSSREIYNSHLQSKSSFYNNPLTIDSSSNRPIGGEQLPHRRSQWTNEDQLNPNMFPTASSPQQLMAESDNKEDKRYNLHESCSWNGRINLEGGKQQGMDCCIKPVCTDQFFDDGLNVSEGRDLLQLKEVFDKMPKELAVVGTIGENSVIKYVQDLSKLNRTPILATINLSKNRDSVDDKNSYWTMIDSMNRHGRFYVVNTDRRIVKNFYILPRVVDKPLPQQLRSLFADTYDQFLLDQCALLGIIIIPTTKSSQSNLLPENESMSPSVAGPSSTAADFDADNNPNIEDLAAEIEFGCVDDDNQDDLGNDNKNDSFVGVRSQVVDLLKSVQNCPDGVDVVKRIEEFMANRPIPFTVHEESILLNLLNEKGRSSNSDQPSITSHSPSNPGPSHQSGGFWNEYDNVGPSRLQQSSDHQFIMDDKSRYDDSSWQSAVDEMSIDGNEDETKEHHLLPRSNYYDADDPELELVDWNDEYETAPQTDTHDWAVNDHNTNTLDDEFLYDSPIVSVGIENAAARKGTFKIPSTTEVNMITVQSSAASSSSTAQQFYSQLPTPSSTQFQHSRQR